MSWAHIPNRFEADTIKWSMRMPLMWQNVQHKLQKKTPNAGKKWTAIKIMMIIASNFSKFETRILCHRAADMIMTFTFSFSFFHPPPSHSHSCQHQHQFNSIRFQVKSELKMAKQKSKNKTEQTEKIYSLINKWNEKTKANVSINLKWLFCF